MNPNEIQFLIWSCVTLLAVIAFIGVVFINYFMGMAKDINKIKTFCEVHTEKHHSLEERVSKIENQLEEA